MVKKSNFHVKNEHLDYTIYQFWGRGAYQW